MYDMSVIREFAIVLIKNNVFGADLLDSENIIALWFAINSPYYSEFDEDGTVQFVRNLFAYYIDGGSDFSRFSVQVAVSK